MSHGADCHKGIAHELHDMTGVEPGWREPPELRGKESLRLDEQKELGRYLAENQTLADEAQVGQRR